MPPAGPVIRPAIITSRRPIVNSQGPPWLPGRRLAARRGPIKTELNVLQLPAVTAPLPARRSRRPVTYQEMARYWPQLGEPQARPMNTLPKLAVSATLTEPVLEQRSLGRRAISIARSARSSSSPARPGSWAASALPAPCSA